MNCLHSPHHCYISWEVIVLYTVMRLSSVIWLTPYVRCWVLQIAFLPFHFEDAVIFFTFIVCYMARRVFLGGVQSGNNRCSNRNSLGLGIVGKTDSTLRNSTWYCATFPTNAETKCHLFLPVGQFVLVAPSYHSKLAWGDPLLSQGEYGVTSTSFNSFCNIKFSAVLLIYMAWLTMKIDFRHFTLTWTCQLWHI